MSYKITVCITETLQRLIEVDIDEMDGDAVESIRRQYLDGGDHLRCWWFSSDRIWNHEIALLTSSDKIFHNRNATRLMEVDKMFGVYYEEDEDEWRCDSELKK